MKTVKVGVVGAGGRMGREIGPLLQAHARLRPAFALHGKTVPEGFAKSGRTLNESAEGVDVWIDFSTPGGLEKILNYAVRHGQPLVSGTTGLSAPLRGKMEKAAKKVPILWSSNMSVGIAVLRQALAVLRSLEGFDVQVEESHHRLKKDAPSGTALTLQEDLEKHLGRELPEPLSIRAGGIVGQHRVLAVSNEEMIVFEHNALNRAVFARGAVRAAEWIVNQPPGFYSMRDLLMASDI